MVQETNERLMMSKYSDIFLAVWDVVTTQSPTPTFLTRPVRACRAHRSSSAPLQRTRDVRCVMPPPVAPGPLAAHHGRQPGSREQLPLKRPGLFTMTVGGGVRIIDLSLKGMLFVGKGGWQKTLDIYLEFKQNQAGFAVRES